ncbi:hypothetical protein DAI22_02g365332 [Oryza sativa Japonica Group]|nr:hypothetical protein DAI22_02g365332 [Oryza sativa Japonica Group]
MAQRWGKGKGGGDAVRPGPKFGDGRKRSEGKIPRASSSNPPSGATCPNGDSTQKLGGEKTWRNPTLFWIAADEPRGIRSVEDSSGRAREREIGGRKIGCGRAGGGRRGRRGSPEKANGEEDAFFGRVGEVRGQVNVFLCPRR